MKNPSVNFERYSRVAFVILCVILVALSAANTLQKRWNISADMAYLLDSQPNQNLAQQWLKHSAKDFENQFVLVFDGELDDSAYEAEPDVTALINQFEQTNASLFEVFDPTDSLETLATELLPFSANFLNPAMADLSNNQIKTWMRQQAYRSNINAFPGISPLQDPLESLRVAIQGALPAPATDFFAERITLVGDSDTKISLPLTYRLNSSGLNLATQQTVVTQVNKLETELQQLLPGFSLLRLGPVFHAQFAAQSMKSDLTLIATGSSLGIILLFIVVFGRATPLFASLGSVAIGFAAAFVICNWWFAQLHFIVLVFGASLIGVCVDFSLHFFCKYYSQNASGTAVARSISAPLLLSLASSVLGYGCLSLSGLSSLLQIAVFSGVGLIAAWIFLLSYASLLGKPRQMRTRLIHLANPFDKLIGVFFSHKRVVMLSTAVLSIFATGILYSRYQTSDNPRLMYHTSERLIQDLLIAAPRLSRFDASRALVVTGSDDNQVLERLEKLQPHLQAWQNQKLLKNFTSVLTLIPPVAMQREHFTRNQALFAANGPVAQALRELGYKPENVAATLSSQQQLTFKPLLPSQIGNGVLSPWWFHSADGSAAIIQIAAQQPKALQTAVLKLNDDQLFYVDRAQQISSILETIRIKAQYLLAAAYAAILGLFALYYRFDVALKLIAIPLLSSVMSVTVLTFLGPLNAFHIFALYLVLGLGIDYAVFHQASRYQRSPATLAAIVLAAATSLLSFGLLGLSDTPMLGDFGKTLCLGISCNLAAILLLQTLVPARSNT